MPLQQLTYALSRLPGLGRRSAERAALALIRRPADLLDNLTHALQQARANIILCDLCGAVTDRTRNPCRLCTDPTRDDKILCIVEETGDIIAIERSGAFNGRYHALLGKLSAARASGPSQLRIQELIHRIRQHGYREIILAISTDVEGDATAAWLAETLRDTPVTISRIALGLPVDSGVGYSDSVTLKRAIGGRQSLSLPPSTPETSQNESI